MSHSADSPVPELPTSDSPPPESPGAERLGYTLWAVLRRDPQNPYAPEHEDVAQLDELVDSLASEGVVVRGFYDVSALRADADVMIWLHGEVPEAACTATPSSRGATAPRSCAARSRRRG
jgi:chlorite dismutase